MNLSAFDWLLVAGISLGNTVLFAVLILRRRWKEFPVFTAFIGIDTILSPVLYILIQFDYYS